MVKPVPAMFAPSTALLRALARSSLQPINHHPSSRTSTALTAASAVSFCQACAHQRSLFHNSSSTKYANASPQPSEPPNPSPKPQKALDEHLRTPEMRHRRHRDGELQPKPLSKPLGLPYPPQAGQNTGRDTRTWQQKREDFGSYDKHLQRRREMLMDVFQNNYYKDIGNLGKVYRGKSILAPQTPFRAELAAYFPNLEGVTLDSRGQLRDTTPVILGRISIVSMLNTEWATGQAATFTSTAANPELAVYMKSAEAREAGAQFVTVNVEENPLKAFLVRLFWGRLRRIFPKEQWGTYFLNKRGLTEEIRDALGMWNSKVGYVYLVDGRGRIRWAGNGEARDEEKKSLVYCVKRLVAEIKGVQRMKLNRQEPLRTAKQDGAAVDHAVASTV